MDVAAASHDTMLTLFGTAWFDDASFWVSRLEVVVHPLLHVAGKIVKSLGRATVSKRSNGRELEKSVAVVDFFRRGYGDPLVHKFAK